MPPSDPTAHANKVEETVIASIRLTGVALSLQRLPAGFYSVVHHSELEWRTKVERLLVDNDIIEWVEPIPIPSDLSATIDLKIYAAFELDHILGTGEQLRSLTVTVGELLDCSTKNTSFIHFPNDEELFLPSSSISISVRRLKRVDVSDTLRGAVSHSIAKSTAELEDATNNGHIALLHYRRHGKRQDLEYSVEEFERALSICPPDHPCLAAAQSNLAMAKVVLCQVMGTNASLDVPLKLYCNALAARPIGHADRPRTLIQLAAVYLARSIGEGNGNDGAHAEELLLEAMGLSSTDSYEIRAASFVLRLRAEPGLGAVQMDGQWLLGQGSTSSSVEMGSLVSSVQLLERFEQLGDPADLQQAITLLRTLIGSITLRDGRYLLALVNLGMALAYRFECFGKQSDLGDSILVLKEAIDLTPDGNSATPACLNNLGNSLITRFECHGDLRDLEDALSRHKDAVALTPRGDPDEPSRYNNLGQSLLSRFRRLGELDDLECAISRLRDGVDLSPRHHPQRPGHSNNLGNSLTARFEHLGELGDLEEAISSYTDAVELTPRGHLRKSRYLNNLGVSLRIRFERLGELTDLQHSISMLGEAVDLTPTGHPEKAVYLSNFGNSLCTRFEHLGELRDLEDAILRHRDAVGFTPPGHTSAPRHLASLGDSIIVRFEHLGELGDLTDAISAFRGAVALAPDGHINKPRYLGYLGRSLMRRFERLGEPSDFLEAFVCYRHAVHLTPDGHPHRPSRIDRLGECLITRFLLLGEPSDLENAISMIRDAVDLIPHDHPDKPSHLINLGRALSIRFEYLGELADLEEAVLVNKNAVDLTPDTHTSKILYLNNLATSLSTRFWRLGTPSDLEDAIFLYSHAASAPIGSIRDRFSIAKSWISCAQRARHHSLLHAYSIATALLPQLAWTGLSLKQRYEELTQGADVVREAAAAALDAGLPDTALEWLEQGRSIVWGELLQLRNSYEELSSAHPEHARKLRALSGALEYATSSREKSLSAHSERASSMAHPAAGLLRREAQKHRMLAIQRDKLLRQIRRFPGFERFLLRKDFSQLRVSAHSGPVVVLTAAETRCDALVVLADTDHVIHVPLPAFTFQRSEGLQKVLETLLGHARATPRDDRIGQLAPRVGVSWTALLSNLWQGVVKPVLDGLAFSTLGDLSRIFWCPMGPFVFLPIHAAGLYGIQYLQPGNKVSDFVVSSYIPALRILTSAPSSSATPSNNLRLLTVRQPPSDGLSRLPGVATELERIRTVIRQSSSAHTTLVESSAGTVEEVLSLMKTADWVHFACHGIQDAEDSGLCLADRRRLKVRDIIALSRPRGGLAFLSACQTAMGEEGLSDEAIHIAAGMLFAGYGGVIGTMWSISDALAPRVARDVYAYLFRDGAKPDAREAARALHEAIRGVRERGDASFETWLPFIHVGL